jgi:hypothetical protein
MATRSGARHEDRKAHHEDMRAAAMALAVAATPAPAGSTTIDGTPHASDMATLQLDLAPCLRSVSR